MTPERWQDVRRIFHEILERPPSERGAFLDDACAGDREVLEEVQSLLASHEEAGSFLESPAMAAGMRSAVLSPGTRLGPYEITGLLAVGGMGEIYRARDTRLARDVAVKVLPAGLAGDSERLRRFEQEARAASTLNHPHIVATYDVGRQEGLAYIVTELLEGETLADRLEHGPLPVRKALEYAVQVARGLAAAHERGIVHRDLKPSNLFLTAEGQIKILDFGLAKSASLPLTAVLGTGNPPQTTPGLAMGTVGYMSPEQIRGEKVDFRSDQFSFGCVAYELLTGQTPFSRPTGAQTLAAVLEDEPVSIAVLNPRVPLPIAWIVERCLSKEAQDRYAATRDLLRDIELAATRVSATSEPRAAIRPKTARRRMLAWFAAAVALVSLGAVAAWLTRSRPAPVPSVRFLTYSGRDSSPCAAPDGRTVVFSSTRDGRRRLWLKHLATGSEVPLTEGEDDHPRYSADGSLLLFARSQDTRVSLFRVPAVGGEPRRLVEDALYGDFAPDGRRICFVRQFVEGAAMTSVVGIASADGGRPRELARFPGRALVQPRWSPDGKMLAVIERALQAGEPTGIALVDVGSGEVRWLEPRNEDGTWPGGLVWAGEAKVAYSQPESVVGVQTGTGRSRVLLHDVRSGKARTVFWSLANTLVLDVLGPGRLVLESRSLRQNLREVVLGARASSTRARWLTRGNSTDRQPIYSPDGEWVAFSSNRAGNLDLWAVSARSGAVRRLTDDRAEDWDPAFTRRGELLWSSNRTGNFEVWMAEADGTGARQVTSDGVDAENPVATPDGAWIVYASANPSSRGIMKIRPDGSEATRLVPGNLVLPEISPDGRHLAFVADEGSERAALRVARVVDGALTRFGVPLPAWVPGGSIDVGRCRWFPNGRALAFIGREADGTYAVYAQDFDPGSDTSASRRVLVPADPDFAAESLAISPDGAQLTVAYWDHRFDLMLAENVPGIGRPRRAAAE